MFQTQSYGISHSEKYSRGRRGAPAKGVGRATGARVQIPLSPLFIPNDSFFYLNLMKSKRLKKIKKVVDKLRKI